MRVLLTGGGGYLGSTLLPLLLDSGHSVRVFDRFCFGREALDSWSSSPHCEIIQGDVRRFQEFPALLDEIEAIIHLASLSNDPSCDLVPEMTADVNVESTRELAKLAIQRGIRRFVFGSSCAVYGKGVFELLDEQSPPNPVSAFASGKLEAERLLLDMKTDRFEPVIARTGTMFGRSPRMRFDLAVNHMVAAATRNRLIEVVGGGNQWRPFVHVADAARAFLTLLEASAATASGQVFNVGGSALNWRIADLARHTAEILGDCSVDLARDDDDRRTYRVCFDKIEQTLGFRPERSIEDGVREVRAWLQETGKEPYGEDHVNVARMRRLLATPVEEGGEPIAPRFIAVSKPYLGPEEEKVVIEVLRSGWLTSGPHIPSFERAFSETVGAAHTVAVSSCTAALHLCLAYLGVGSGDEVITPPVTWASTGNTLVHMGSKPVFADLLPGSLNIDPAAIERAITPRTRAIVPVHMAGLPCDMDAIRAISARHGIPVIEDAAHALGATYHGVAVGGGEALTCFSFYPIKNITTIEGGTITCKDPDAASRLRLLAANGMAATAWERYGRSAVSQPSEVIEPGFKYLMGNVSAAIGVEQLKKFSAFKAARKRLAALYRVALGDIDEIRLPEEAPAGVEHAWHLFAIRLRLDRLDKTRDEIVAALRRENIGTSVNFFGLHLHRYYRETLGYRPEDFPNATAVSYEVLSLPLHPLMTDRNIHDVAEALKKVIAHARR